MFCCFKRVIFLGRLKLRAILLLIYRFDTIEIWLWLLWFRQNGRLVVKTRSDIFLLYFISIESYHKQFLFFTTLFQGLFIFIVQLRIILCIIAKIGCLPGLVLVEGHYVLRKSKLFSHRYIIYFRSGLILLDRKCLWPNLWILTILYLKKFLLIILITHQNSLPSIPMVWQQVRLTTDWHGFKNRSLHFVPGRRCKRNSAFIIAIIQNKILVAVVKT